jgi:probable phosphoglycerate mutase
MKTRITLIRHGETLWNSQRRWQGRANIPLSPNGIQQAEETAALLQRAGITRVISSDLRRAARTAQIIAGALGLPVQEDPRWREVDVGDWQGMSTEEILEWEAAAFERFRQVPFMERYFPGGETNIQHVARVGEALDHIAEQYPGEHVLVATHGGSVRCAVYHVSQQMIPGGTPNCSLTRLEFHRGNGGWRVLGMCEAAGAIAWR